MSNNPVDELLDELLEAHDRQRAATRPGSARARRSLRRPALVVPAVVLAFAASAAAAIVIATHRSAPLKGILPRQLLGSRYSLTVAPELTAGHAGWCISLLTVTSTTPVSADPPYCVPATDGPLITRGGLLTVSPRTGTVEGSLLYAIVRANVYALRRPDGTRILPISSPDLPTAWRAAVTIQTTARRPRGAIVTLVPIRADGSEYPTSTSSPAALNTVPVTASSGHRNGCEVMTSDASQLQLTDARALTGSPRGVSGANPGFLSCFSAGLSLDGHASTVALLVNAADPRSVPSLLPGSRRVRGARGTSVSPAAGPARLYVRRAGDALLVLETSAPQRAAIAALDVLDGLDSQ